MRGLEGAAGASLGLAAFAFLLKVARFLTAAADMSGNLGMGNFRMENEWPHPKGRQPISKRRILPRRHDAAARQVRELPGLARRSPLYPQAHQIDGLGSAHPQPIP